MHKIIRTDCAGILKVHVKNCAHGGLRKQFFIFAAGEKASILKKAGTRLMRIGQGYDVHRLVEGRKLILGGVDIPYGKGLDGHSDADVLVHAIMDAMLGAAAMGDIGLLFPDTDDKWKGADSMVLLKHTAQKLMSAGYHIVNIDATVIAQAPKLRPYIDEMRNNISQALDIDIGCVSVKATTEEKLGFTGRGEGIAAQAVVLIDN